MERFKKIHPGADVEGTVKGKTAIVKAIGHLPPLNKEETNFFL